MGTRYNSGKKKEKRKPYYICSYFLKKITTHDWNFTLELTQYQTCSHWA
jgi:hypothetical protein